MPSSPMLHRWYLGLEGFTRTDQSTLTNSLDGLVTAASVNRASWSALIGYAYRDAWVLEGGYARMPIHNQLTLVTAPQSVAFTFTNESHAAMLRFKRRLFQTGKRKNQAGLWLTAGAYIVPSSGKYVDGFIMEGYRYRRFQTAPDTLLLLSQTETAKRTTGMLELGLEYNVRLSNRLEMGFYGRKIWGLQKALVTEMIYSENSVQTQSSRITATGTGWSLGLALRYTYSFRRSMKSVYDLHGKYGNQ
ncbi:hypothetical protein [Siphonobacter sp.]|uniref:hypothetical protein n=1 Tax=Siphonobacter sp. TaxID=1869184 RepID=UPI003B3BCB47